MGISIPSAEDYEAQRTGSGTSDYTLLPEDDYVVEIKEIEVRENQVDQFRKTEDGKPFLRDMLLVRLRPITFANGDELVDENGDEVGNDRLFFAFIDPTRVGLYPQASKARKFFAAALGVGIEDRIDIDDYSDLEGKRLVVTTVHNNGKSKVTDFRVLRNRRPRTKKSDDEVAVEAASRLSDVDAEVVQKAATDVFSDDLPF